jgi:hypothetical protein
MEFWLLEWLEENQTKQKDLKLEEQSSHEELQYDSFYSNVSVGISGNL